MPAVSARDTERALAVRESRRRTPDPPARWRVARGDGSFLAAANYAVGHHPVTLASGDFNGDRKSDLAVVNQTDHTISILLGGHFGDPPVTYNVGNNPVGIVAADLHQKGIIDFAVVDGTSSVVNIFLGGGNGTTFGSAGPTTPIAGSSPTAITAGDFDGNGKIDLAVTNSGNDTVSIFYGTGDGLFSSPSSYAVGRNPRALAADDFDAAGNLDLVVSSLGAGLSVLLNSGCVP